MRGRYKKAQTIGEATVWGDVKFAEVVDVELLNPNKRTAAQGTPDKEATESVGPSVSGECQPGGDEHCYLYGDEVGGVLSTGEGGHA